MHQGENYPFQFPWISTPFSSLPPTTTVITRHPAAMEGAFQCIGTLEHGARSKRQQPSGYWFTMLTPLYSDSHNHRDLPCLFPSLTRSRFLISVPLLLSDRHQYRCQCAATVFSTSFFPSFSLCLSLSHSLVLSLSMVDAISWSWPYFTAMLWISNNAFLRNFRYERMRS